MIVVNSGTRQFTVPGADLVFGVTSDSGSERKDFQCPRYVGNNLDVAGSFVRINYRNANGEIDSYLVGDLAVDGDNVVFSWVLTPKVTRYKGQVKFVMCVVGPDLKVKWHTTLGTGQVLEGLEPDSDTVEAETADVVAQLIAMVEAQTAAVERVGAEQVNVVKAAAEAAETASVAEIEAKGVNTRNSIPADYTALSEAVGGLMRSRAGAIVCEVEGSAVVVNDASDMAIQGLRIFGRSTQDGTPTPDAPVEIKSVVEPVVTVAGKNLLNMDSLTDDNFVKNSDGSYTLTKTGIGDLRFSAKADLRLPVGVYTLSAGAVSGTDTAARFVFTNVDNREVSHSVTSENPKVITVDNPVKKVSLYISTSLPDGTYVTMSDVMLEVGSKATAYEPYKPIQTVELTHTLPGIPVTSGGNYTDSDGQQWICDEVDLERGVYVQRVGVRVFTGTTETWKDGTISASGQHYVYLADATVTVLNGSVCSHGVSNYSGSWNTGSYWRSGTGLFQVFSDMSLSEWKDYLIAQNTAGTPVTLQFRMDTPIETTLSETEIAAYRAMHSNYPNTTVLNDAGAHMVVKYAADTKLYIDNKIAALAAQA